MNKFAIPTILLDTVMVAGMFAFMPVERASTVHTSGAITTAGGGILDSAEDLTDREIEFDDDDISITIGTDNDTPFYVHQIIACGSTADDGDAVLEIISLTVDGDDILRQDGTFPPANVIFINNQDLDICMNLVGIFNDDIQDLISASSIASDGGDIVITINGRIGSDTIDPGDTLTSVKVVATVQSGANIEIESSLGVEI